MFCYDKGIKLLHQALWLDARTSVEACCVSHGHSDHIRRHRLSLATPATAAFMRHRLGHVKIRQVDFQTPVHYGPYRITFLPAGHILGSAQILVENEQGALLYSGDFKLETGRTAEPLVIRSCNILIMESTYGHPKFKFPPREELEARLCEFVHSTLRRGRVPLIYGYALGKAQEAMKILADHGFPLAVHASLMRYVSVYQEHGIDFGEVMLFKKSLFDGRRPLILPPQARFQKQIRNLGATRSLFLSGWGLDPGAKYRYGVDEVLPLSDHADFDDLIEYIDRVKPKTVYTTHGPADFYLLLRQKGYDAHPLAPPRQGELFK